MKRLWMIVALALLAGSVIAANVVNKADPSNFRLSANTPEFPTDEWLINPPGLDALRSGGVPPRYWKLNAGGDNIEEMTRSEKDSVDATILADLLANRRLASRDLFSRVDAMHWRAIVIDYNQQLNLLKQQHGFQARTKAQAMQRLRAIITAGDSDN